MASPSHEDELSIPLLSTNPNPRSSSPPAYFQCSNQNVKHAATTTTIAPSSSITATTSTPAPADLEDQYQPVLAPMPLACPNQAMHELCPDPAAHKPPSNDKGSTYLAGLIFLFFWVTTFFAGYGFGAQYRGHPEDVPIPTPTGMASSEGSVPT